MFITIAKHNNLMAEMGIKNHELSIDNQKLLETIQEHKEELKALRSENKELNREIREITTMDSNTLIEYSINKYLYGRGYMEEIE